MAKRWWFWTTIVLIVVVVAAGIALGIRKKDSNSSGTSTTHAAAVAGTSTTTPHRPTVTTTTPPSTTTTRYVPPTAFFNCSGSAPGGVSITYGTNSSSRPGGTSLPWQAYLPVTADIEFFDVSARFQGSGSIKCTTLVYVNGTRATQIGTASESRDIASAKVCSTSAGKWRPC